MRLIDADKLIEKLRDFKEWENDDGRPSKDTTPTSATEADGSQADNVSASA